MRIVIESIVEVCRAVGAAEIYLRQYSSGHDMKSCNCDRCFAARKLGEIYTMLMKHQISNIENQKV